MAPKQGNDKKIPFANLPGTFPMSHSTSSSGWDSVSAQAEDTSSSGFYTGTSTSGWGSSSSPSGWGVTDHQTFANANPLKPTPPRTRPAAEDASWVTSRRQNKSPGRLSRQSAVRSGSRPAARHPAQTANRNQPPTTNHFPTGRKLGRSVANNPSRPVISVIHDSLAAQGAEAGNSTPAKVANTASNLRTVGRSPGPRVVKPAPASLVRSAPKTANRTPVAPPKSPVLARTMANRPRPPVASPAATAPITAHNLAVLESPRPNPQKRLRRTVTKARLSTCFAIFGILFLVGVVILSLYVLLHNVQGTAHPQVFKITKSQARRNLVAFIAGMAAFLMLVYLALRQMIGGVRACLRRPAREYVRVEGEDKRQ